MRLEARCPKPRPQRPERCFQGTRPVVAVRQPWPNLAADLRRLWSAVVRLWRRESTSRGPTAAQVPSRGLGPFMGHQETSAPIFTIHVNRGSTSTWEAKQEQELSNGRPEAINWPVNGPPG
jgi:hypothetical protein